MLLEFPRVKLKKARKQLAENAEEEKQCGEKKYHRASCRDNRVMSLLLPVHLEMFWKQG